MPSDREHRVEHVGGGMPEMIGSRIPSTMKLSGLYCGDRLRRLDHQFLGEEGGREEEDDEDQREEPLDDAGAAGAQGDRGADPADRQRRSAVTRTIASSAPATPLSILAPKISPIAKNQSGAEERRAPRSRRAGRGRS